MVNTLLLLLLLFNIFKIKKILIKVLNRYLLNFKSKLLKCMVKFMSLDKGLNILVLTYKIMVQINKIKIYLKKEIIKGTKKFYYMR